MPKTKAPCPGCGWEPGRYQGRHSWRESDRLCEKCMVKYRQIPDLEYEITRLRGLLESKGQGTKLYGLDPEWAYLSMPFGSGRDVPELDKLAARLVATVQALVAPLSRGRKLGWNEPKVPSFRDNRSRSSYLPIEITPAAARELRRLDVALDRALNAAFFAGLHQGRNFLLDIATGNATLENVETKVAERVKQCRETAAQTEGYIERDDA